MENTFNAGDIVNLKSNKRHTMTIEMQTPDGLYKCIWQDAKTNKMQSDFYPGVVLEIWKRPTIRVTSI